jgi:hypothetical protein
MPTDDADNVLQHYALGMERDRIEACLISSSAHASSS